MVTVYSKSNCPNCDKLKAFLTMNEVDFTVLLVDYDLEAKEFLLSAGHRSVPQVYKDGKFVGGFSDLIKLDTAQLKTKGLSNVNKQAS